MFRRGRRRRAADLEEPSDEDDDTSPEDDNDDDDVENSDPRQAGPSLSPTVSRKRPSGGAPYSRYAVGAIKRLTLKNFLVYRQACAHFGPHMNMILGPNGAGKSSLLNGICLVLGGKPAVLGRQKNIKDFVRLGQQKGWIEIELQGRIDSKADIVIRREINAEGASKWWIDGKLSSEKALKELARTLHLQVDNLCQFLPQDRVSDFSGMNMYELLENTLKAIGDQKLSENYEKLKELGQTIQKGRGDLAAVTRKVLALSTEKARLEKEVIAFREMAQLRKEVGLLRVKRLLLVTREKDEVVQAIEVEVKAVESAIKELERKIRPNTDKIKDMKKNLDDFKKQLQPHEQTGNVIELRIVKVKGQAGEAMDAYAELYSDWSSSKETLKSQEETVEKVKQIVRTMEVQLEKGLAELDRPVDELRKEAKNFAKAHDNIRRTANELMSKKAEVEVRITGLDRRIETEISRLNGVQNTNNKKLLKLRELNEDAYKALMILRGGSMQFRGKVYEPPLVSMEIPNPEHRKVVETYLPMRDLVAFYFEFTEDQNAFSDEMRSNRKLKINCIHAEVTQEERRRSRSFIAPDVGEVRHVGISGFVSDTFDVSCKALKEALCRDHWLHQIPIGDEKTYKNAAKICEDYGFQRVFVAFGQCAYSIQSTKSKYSGASSTSFTPVMPRNTFDFGQDNREVEAALRNSVQKLKSERDQLAQTAQQLGPEAERRAQEEREWREKREEADRELMKITSLERNLSAKAAELERAEARLQELKRRGCDSYNKSEAAMKRFVESLRPLKKLVGDMMRLMRGKFHMDLRYKAMAESIKKAEEEIASVTQERRRKVEELEIVSRKLNEAKAEMKEASDEQNMLKSKLEKEFKEQITFDQLANLPDSIDGVENELGVKEPRLRVSSNDVTQRSVDEFEKLSAELHDSEQKKVQLEVACAGVDEKFDRVLSDWRPKAEEVIGAINERFKSFIESIGCAGQVALRIPDDQADVDKYGAEILVKFRVNEPLSPLSSTRHSGGERSVCTMIYMMSMQELTKVPFRCVDEINQGMDETNEKRVFEVLTSLARTSSAQYILLTPKLIPGLEVSKSVTVLTLMRYIRAKQFCFQDYSHKLGFMSNEEDNRICKFCK